MKYIIDLPEEFAEATKEYWDKTVGTQLEPYTEPGSIEDEVWKFLIFLVDEMDSDDKYECFGISSSYAIVSTMSYQEAKTKYKAWMKQKNEIHVGDELKDDGNIRAVVLDILDADYESYEVFTENGIVDEWQKGIVVKTGRHFDEVEGLLKKIRGKK